MAIMSKQAYEALVFELISKTVDEVKSAIAEYKRENSYGN